MSTGYHWNEIYGWHENGMAAGWVVGLPAQPEPHAESPQSKQRVNSLFEVSGIKDSLVAIKGASADEEDLSRFHDEGYIALVKELSEGNGGHVGENAIVGKDSYKIATLAAGGCYATLEAVLKGTVNNAYALIRPPGHHAEANQGRGFCLFANIALAIMKARAEKLVEKVAVIDWDVHHGNGTQAAFYGSPEVLTISIHQDNLYPADSGSIDEVGEGDGEGYNINIPLPPGSGTGAYLHAFDEVVEPAVEAFDPDAIIVAAGFDASALDPLGNMILHSDDYREMTARVKRLAEKLCSGKLMLVHEGGYSTSYVPFCALASVEELTGTRTWAQDPFLEAFKLYSYRDLQPHQQDVVAKVKERVKGGPLGI